MTEQKRTVKEGDVIFSSGGPWYGVVVNREAWLKEAESENPETVQSFLKMEKEDHLQEVPVMLLGDFVDFRLVYKKESNGPRMQKYVKRWAYTNLEGHVSVIKNPADLIKFIGHAFNFCRNEYLEQVSSELQELVDYLDDPRLTKGPGGSYFQLWELFQKMLLR